MKICWFFLTRAGENLTWNYISCKIYNPHNVIISLNQNIYFYIHKRKIHKILKTFTIRSLFDPNVYGFHWFSKNKLQEYCHAFLSWWKYKTLEKIMQMSLQDLLTTFFFDIWKRIKTKNNHWPVWLEGILCFPETF